MTSLQGAVAKLSSTAVLGTSKSGFAPLKADCELGQALELLQSDDPATLLLNTSALVLPYVRSGTPLQTAPAATPPLPADSDTLSECTAIAASTIQQIIETQDFELFEEALFLLANHRQRLPYNFLPQLLDLGGRRKVLRPRLLKVIGERGRWLANLNSAWSYVASSERPTVNIVDHERWKAAPLEMRLEQFSSLRDTAPNDATKLLLTIWKEESANSRAQFIRIFSKSLSSYDEQFLEIALDDKSLEVRKLAQSLLIRLPMSRLSLSSASYAQSLLTFNNRLSGDFYPIVQLPDNYLPHWKRDGIEETSWIKDIGDRAWWFIQWVGRVPPETWSQKYSQSPEQLMTAAARSEWSDTLRLAWTVGANISNDKNWIYSIVKYWASARDQRTSISGLIPNVNDISEMAPNLIIELLDRDMEPLHDQHLALPVIQQYRGTWDNMLTRRVIKSLQRRQMKSADKSKQTWQTITVLRLLAYKIDPVIAGEFIDIWTENAAEWKAWAAAVEYFENVLNIRLNLHKEFR